MNKENKEILKVNINEKKSNVSKKIEEYFEGIYELFYFILKNPINNFYWECISLTLQYGQLLILILDDTVSIIIIILLYIVFAYMAPEKRYKKNK
jgi:hypothetical protein